jgi:hypothetical protein
MTPVVGRRTGEDSDMGLYSLPRTGRQFAIERGTGALKEKEGAWLDYQVVRHEDPGREGVSGVPNSLIRALLALPESSQLRAAAGCLETWRERRMGVNARMQLGAVAQLWEVLIGPWWALEGRDL